MEKRVAVSAGILAVTPPVALAIFEVMQWKMQVWVAIALLSITAVVGLAALLFLLHAAWVWSRPYRARYGLRLQVYDRNEPNPNQWLLDMAEKQLDNPTSHLVITERIMLGNNLGDNRPWLRLRVRLANYGVHDLIISQPEGYPYFGNEKSSDFIRDQGGTHNVPAGNTATSFDLDIYIPAEFLEDVRGEVDLSGEVRSIRLGQLRVMVRANAEGAPSVGWSIGGDPEVFR